MFTGWLGMGKDYKQREQLGLYEKNICEII